MIFGLSSISYFSPNNMDPDPKDELSEMEMEAVTTVFRQYETGLREAAINARVFNYCLVMHPEFFVFLYRTCWQP